ncbi:hypothetical protein G6F58_012927 [Rhizopus delemar]|nr:hypothetical protein G6F58_012927 [Rhizopus delemar]
MPVPSPAGTAATRQTRRRPAARCHRWHAAAACTRPPGAAAAHRHRHGRARRWSGGSRPARSLPRPAASCCAQHAPARVAAVLPGHGVPAPARRCAARHALLPAARWPGGRAPAPLAAAPCRCRASRPAAAG